MKFLDIYAILKSHDQALNQVEFIRKFWGRHEFSYRGTAGRVVVAVDLNGNGEINFRLLSDNLNDKWRKALLNCREDFLDNIFSYYKDSWDRIDNQTGLYGALLTELARYSNVPVEIIFSIGGDNSLRDKCIISTFWLSLLALNADFSKETRYSLIHELSKFDIELSEPSKLINVLRTLKHSYIPRSNKYVVITRYALFSILHYLYPQLFAYDDTSLLCKDNDKIGYYDPLTIEENFINRVFEEDSVLLLQQSIQFDIPKVKDRNGRWIEEKNPKIITVNLSGVFATPFDNDEELRIFQRETLDLLYDAYNNLGGAFHEQFSSTLKREVNTTISQFVLSCAYSGLFQSELGRNKLLEIASTFVSTNNHHSSYLFSFVEKDNKNHDLFNSFDLKELQRDDSFSNRALTIFAKYYDSLWLTYSTANADSFSSRFVEWVGRNNTNVFKHLIDEHHCFSANIWNAYANSHNLGKNELRDFVKINVLLNNTHSTKDSHRRTVCLFLGMLSRFSTSKNFDVNWVLLDDESYNRILMKFLTNVVRKIGEYPEHVWPTINQSLAHSFEILRKTYGENETAVQDLMRNQSIDWDSSCYSYVLKNYRESVLGNNIIGNKINAIESKDRVITALKSYTESDNYLQVIYFLKKSFSFNLEEYTESDFETINIGLFFALRHYNSANNLTALNKQTLLSTYRYWRHLTTKSRDSLIDYASEFIEDHSNYSETKSLILAIQILSKDEQCDNRILSEIRNVLFFSTHKSDRRINYHLISSIIDIFIHKYGVEFLVEKIISDSKENNSDIDNSIGVLCRNSKVLSKALDESNSWVLVEELLNTKNFWRLSSYLQKSIVHYSKKLSNLSALVYILFNDALTRWESLDDCLRFAFVSHLRDFCDFIPPVIDNYIDTLISDALVDLRSTYKRCGTKEDTFIYHICEVSADEPERTSALCAYCIALIEGQIRHEVESGNAVAIDAHRSRRQRLLKTVLSNPCIKNFAKAHCRQLLSLIMNSKQIFNLYAEIMQMLKGICLDDIYPNWFSEVTIKNEDTLSISKEWASELKVYVNEDHIDFLNRINAIAKLEDGLPSWILFRDSAHSAYNPHSREITQFVDSSGKHIIDGKFTAYHCHQVSMEISDFMVTVMTVRPGTVIQSKRVQ